jgi:SAM-dependent methyltransferase
MEQVRVHEVKRDLDKYHKDYNDLPFEPYQEIFRRRNLIRSLSGIDAELILEIGCGRESLFSEYEPPQRAIVVEPISELLRQAKSGVSNPKVEFFGGLLSDFASSEKREMVDVAIASSILHEMKNPQLFLSDCMSVLRPGGLLIVIVTNINSIHRILGVAAGLQKNINSPTSTEKLMQQLKGAYSSETLSDELRIAGFKVESCNSIFPKILPHALMQKALDESLINFEFLEKMDSLMPLLSDFGSELLIRARKP